MRRTILRGVRREARWGVEDMAAVVVWCMQVVERRRRRSAYMS
jgi:hypothetical protein